MKAALAAEHGVPGGTGPALGYTGRHQADDRSPDAHGGADPSDVDRGADVR
jgi:hypothetical protein